MNTKTNQSTWRLPSILSQDQSIQEYTIETATADSDHDGELDDRLETKPKFVRNKETDKTDIKYEQVETSLPNPIPEDNEDSDSTESEEANAINIQNKSKYEPIRTSPRNEHGAILQPVSIASSQSLDLSSQRPTSPLLLHSSDTVWHHIIPYTNKIMCCRKGKLDRNKVDKLIAIIFSKCYLAILIISTLLYCCWILSGANHQVISSVIYWWFFIEGTMLLFAANFRMFRTFLCDFTFWFKVLTLTFGVILRRLVFDGSDGYLSSSWHMFSGISFIFSYFVASQIVAALKAYHWPVYLSAIFILLFCVLNIVQIWRLYESGNDHLVTLMGHNISARNVALSAYTYATIFYLQQLFLDTYYRDYLEQMVKLEWDTHHQQISSISSDFQMKKVDKSQMRLLRISSDRNDHEIHTINKSEE